MFYEEGNTNLPKYKESIRIREELNIAFEDNYLSLTALEAKLKESP
jgi:hypothetical protein